MAEAAQWDRIATEQGHVDAQVNPADCYNEGEGVAKDEAEAARWSLLEA